MSCKKHGMTIRCPLCEKKSTATVSSTDLLCPRELLIELREYAIGSYNSTASCRGGGNDADIDSLLKIEQSHIDKVTKILET